MNPGLNLNRTVSRRAAVRGIVLRLAAGLALSAGIAAPADDAPPAVTAQAGTAPVFSRGVVAADHPLASEAGAVPA